VTEQKRQKTQTKRQGISDKHSSSVFSQSTWRGRDSEAHISHLLSASQGLPTMFSPSLSRYGVWNMLVQLERQ